MSTDSSLQLTETLKAPLNEEYVCFRFINGHGDNSNIDIGKIGLIGKTPTCPLKAECKFSWANDTLVAESKKLMPFDYLTEQNLKSATDKLGSAYWAIIFVRPEVGYRNDIYDDMVEMSSAFANTWFFDCSLKNDFMEASKGDQSVNFSKEMQDGLTIMAKMENNKFTVSNTRKFDSDKLDMDEFYSWIQEKFEVKKDQKESETVVIEVKETNLFDANFKEYATM